MRSDDGPFRIQAVAELTGVPEPTLRAWERRYGVPTPDRTASGYRLYSARHVEEVREMLRLTGEGMAAAEAARLVRVRSAAPPARASSGSAPSANAYSLSTAAILDAVDRFDDSRMEDELRRLMFLGTPPALLENVIVPVMIAIGERWHSGALSVGQEHLASQRIGLLLRDLLRLTQGAEGRDRAVFGAFADDQHEIGLLAMAVRFAGWGMRPLFLGGCTPPSAIRTAVETARPRMVALSCTVTPRPPRARELVDEYAAACGDVPWIVGGAGALAMADRIRARGGIVDPGDLGELEAIVRRVTSGLVGASRKGKKKR